MRTHKFGYMYIRNNNSFNVSVKTSNCRKFTLSDVTDDGTEIIVDVCTNKEKLFVEAEIIKSDGQHRDLYMLSFPKHKGQRYEISYTGVTDTIAPTLINNINLNIYWVNQDERDQFETTDGLLAITRWPTPKEAKQLWKYIKSKGYVSKWIWDPWMGYYDCYCNACKSILHKSWLGNPDIGWVRPKEQVSMDAYEYKNKYYVPCHDKEYDLVTYWNESQYNEIRKNYVPDDSTNEKAVKHFEESWPEFDKLWECSLSQDAIDSQGNIMGGCYRSIIPDEAPQYIAKEKYDQYNPDLIEKVVTVGWHATKPFKAVRCPVCDDIYVIMRSGWKGMVPWYLRAITPFQPRRKFGE